MKSFTIRPIAEGDRDWVRDLFAEHWGSSLVITRGTAHQADALPGFIAAEKGGGVRIGLLTYRIDGDECEIVSLNSLREGIGVGGALLGAATEEARRAGCLRALLITTNDNLPAVRFYQKRGWRLRAVYPGAIRESRRRKPAIPETGVDGIPIRDEIELELPLDGR
ncbi:MAG: GNAT family N-acetyltransferase [Candidatus Eisenbacteria bacterium]|nr:GNAT family N-acetyltransferase [Candidatus Eisenbacteria bacterium]